MNRQKVLPGTQQQKPHISSAKGLINFILMALLLCPFCMAAHGQPNRQDNFYLDQGLLVSRHLTDGSPYTGHSPQPESWSVTNIKTHTLEDADPYYFAFDSNSCHIDPFTSSEDGSENRQLLATCLKSRLWENEDIPLWIRATGATVLIGAAGSAGKVDDDLRLTMGFDKMDSILRDWLSNREQ